jgi:hypothetical protein
VTEAVTTELPLMPNETLLLLLKTTVPEVAVWVPAALAMPAVGLTDAVTVLPLSPNDTPFEFEKTRFERFWLVVPALKLTLVSDVATDAVIVLAFRPNEIPLLFENVKPDARLLVVPALRLMLA